MLRLLTQQRLPILEWDPAWSRFPHLTAPAAADQAYYLVAVNDRDWSKPWRQAAFPGDAPIETNRNLWPKIQKLQQKGAIAILSRHPLGVLDYEIMLISPPLPH